MLRITETLHQYIETYGIASMRPQRNAADNTVPPHIESYIEIMLQ